MKLGGVSASTSIEASETLHRIWWKGLIEHPLDQDQPPTCEAIRLKAENPDGLMIKGNYGIPLKGFRVILQGMFRVVVLT